jgi:hypothetical protein
MGSGEQGDQEVRPERPDETPAPRRTPERPHPVQMRLFPEISATPRLDPDRLRRIAYV